jgi:hypothetical protein
MNRNAAPARKAIEDELKLPANVAAQIPIPTWDLKLTPSGLEAWIKTMEAQGALEPGLDPDQLVYAG